MKRFLTVLTVSLTMVGMAMADNPVVDPDVGEDVGFPFHPGAWITNTLDTDYEWNECFCMPTNTYEEFPNSVAIDPTVVAFYDVLRMTGSDAGAPSFAPSTYVQNPNQKSWDGRVLDMTFYFAAQSTADAMAFYISPTQRTGQLDDKMDFTGLAFIIERSPVWQLSYISVYDATGLVVRALMPIVDPNFHLMRIQYDDHFQMINVQTFEWFEGVTLIDWTPVAGAPDAGWLGFGAFAGTDANDEFVNGYQYLDDICLTITDDHPDIDVSTDALPEGFELKQNYPNPFNPTTSISFVMPETGMATVTVYDLAGSVVDVLHSGLTNAGETELHFDGSSLSSGVYFYTFEAAGVFETRKMVLVK
jgi:hypothetical protein